MSDIVSFVRKWNASQLTERSAAPQLLPQSPRATSPNPVILSERSESKDPEAA